jgi:hypothetical protein
VLALGIFFRLLEPRVVVEGRRAPVDPDLLADSPRLGGREAWSAATAGV